MSTPTTTYRLVRRPTSVTVPTLDADQQAVVDHCGGPLLVLAGPGTGKTTTLVEAIVDRIEQRGARPDEVLALTFSRKAAEQLRDRVTARLGRTLATPVAATFHSFAYGLVRRFAPAELYAAPLRLLSAPEQDVVLRELLADHPESVDWPESLSRAMGTRGFAREVHAVLARAREKGLDGSELAELGRAENLPEFIAAGLFLEQYLNNLDYHGATDYADLIRRATIEAADHRDELRAAYKHVFVDEYQDTDPGQVALLAQLAGDGRNLVAVGDPHQSIYGFRGAEVRGILDFPAQFPQSDGTPADVIALRTTRRFGAHLLLASQRVASRLALPGSIPASAKEAFTAPQAAQGPMGLGKVTVHTFDTERAEAEHLADLLRRAHLEDGIDWADMAVLVRSGRTMLAPLRRSLAAAGVPVEVASDEVPLVRDPAVLPLLDALNAVVNLDNDDPDHVDYLHPDRAESLLTGPLCGLDAGGTRRLARLLRQREKAVAAEEDRTPRTSRELLREAVVDRAVLAALREPEALRALGLAQLLASTRAALDDGASAEEVAWRLWSGTEWPERLRRGVELGGGAARRAHRDLDSICALFEVVARAEEQRVYLSVANLLATLRAQQIPADTLADRGARGSAVRLLTAHRSKGLEWRLVVVAHVQQEAWPDLRRRATLLQADRIGTHGLVPPVTPRELLLEERRLFYVACTRARQRLIVTAVKSADDEGEQPSRFLGELGIDIRHQVGRPTRPLSIGGLVSELRRTLADPDQPEPLRDAAARRLRRLAAETVNDRPLVATADPSTWWGTRAASLSSEPVRSPAEPVSMSASMLEGLIACPTSWFLEREAGGVAKGHQAANLGQLVHALAERVAIGDLPSDDAELLMTHVDAVWDRLEFRTPWSRERERQRIRAAIERFLSWHTTNPRQMLAVEERFSTVVALDDGEQVRLTGYADRLELDADGHVVVVDFKTSRTTSSNPTNVQKNVQLSLYQLAIDQGAVDRTVPEAPARAGGGELVQLGLAPGGPAAVVHPQKPQADDGPERTALRAHLSSAAQMIRAETFPAVIGDHCKWCDFTAICPAKTAGSVTTQ